MKMIIASLVGFFSILSVCAEKPAEKAADKDVAKAVGAVKCAHCDLDIKTDCQKAIETAKGKVILLEGEAVKTFFDANKKAKRVRVAGTRSKDGKYSVINVKTIAEAKGKKKDATTEDAPAEAKKGE